MYKSRFIIMISILLLLFTACNQSISIRMEDKASEFINMYFKQYTMKEKIAEAFEVNIDEDSQRPLVSSKGKIKEYIKDHFGNILTEDAKERLPSNRVIPDTKMINSGIVKAEVVHITYEKAENQKDNTLSFNVDILYEYENGEKREETEQGLIRIKEEDGEMKIDGFKFEM